MPASVIGPVRGPRSSSTSLRRRVAGRSVTVRSATSCVWPIVLGELPESTRRCCGFAMHHTLSVAGDASVGYPLCSCVARSS